MEFLTKISVRNSFHSQAKKYYTNIENKYKFKEIEYEKEEEDTFGGRWSDHDLERNKEKLPWKEEKEVEKGQKIGWEMR